MPRPALGMLFLGLALLSCPTLLPTPCWAQQLNGSLVQSTLYDFESPVVGAGGFAYNPPTTSTQPWTWLPSLGGVAAQGSPFDPPGPTTPVPAPHNVQYAFIQTSPNNAANQRTASMSATLSGLSTSASYYVTFYLGVRLGGAVGEPTPNATQSTVTLTYGAQTVWTSASNVSDASGYLFVQTAPFTPTAASASLTFGVVSQSDLDHCILIDAVLVNPTVALPNATLVVGLTSTFESPVIAGQYDYNTLVSPTQPWSWTPGLGGRAVIGSPLDPPPPSTPPSGTQYAFLQTAPNGQNLTTASMSATISGLVSSTSYFVSFYWGVRAQQNVQGGDVEAGNQTQSSFSVLVNGQVVYQSARNVNDSGGWAYVQTAAWQPVSASNGQATIALLVTSSTLHDHTVLFDDVTVLLAGAIAPPTLADFESPFAAQYVYNPTVTPQQPWTWMPGQGGIGHSNGPWDPPPPSQPPSNTQYAFLQTSPNRGGNQTTWMAATLFNLSSSVSYTVSFYYGARGDTTNSDLSSVGNQTQSQLTLLIGGQQVWQSAANISDPAGWIPVAPISFSGSGNVPINFSVTSVGRDDHAILIDAVQFTSSLPVPVYLAQVGTTYNFENPSLAFTSAYQYNPPTSAFQPFTWPVTVIGGVRYGGGGLAQAGSVFDPPPPSAPPSGTQYAFIQTSANSNTGLQLSNMSTTAYLQGGSSYYITFYYAARSASSQETEPGYQTQSTLTVTLNGNTVWSSGPNITDAAGWFYAQTATFSGVTGPDAVYFVVLSGTNDDHTILVDAVTIVSGTAPALSSTGSAGGASSTGSTGSAGSTGTSSYPPVVFRAGGVLVPDTLYDFESPSASGPRYVYCPALTSTQPWQFPLNPLPVNSGDTCLGGIAQVNGPFDPPAPIQPPNNVQYAFVQTSPNGDVGSQSSYMTAQLTSLTLQAQYTLQFYWAIRAASSVSDTTAGNVTQSLFTVSYAGTTLYTSPSGLTSAGGWTQVSVPLTATVSSGNLIFNVTSLSNQDHAILFDAVIVRSSTAPQPATLAVGTLYGFEYPALGSAYVQYYYNPQQVPGFQPWVWYKGSVQGQGGVAATGSPFDPPPPVAPPQGSQYGFVQVSPDAGGSLSSYMTANVTGLSSGASYFVSWQWAVRAQSTPSDSSVGNLTTAAYVVSLGGAVIYTSAANVSDAGGWSQAYSTTVVAPSAGVVPLTFTVTASAAGDHALLFDSVQITQGMSPAGGGFSSSSASSSPSSSSSSPTTTGGASGGGGGAATSSPTASSTGPAATRSSSSSVPSAWPSFSSSSLSTASSTPVSGVSGGGATGISASSSSSGLSHGAIAGIVIGSVVGAALICLILFLLFSSSRRGGKKAAAREDGSSEPSRNTAQWSEQREEGEDHATTDEVEMQTQA